MPKLSIDELRDYTSMAEAGDVSAQIYLGWAYIDGKLVDKNDAFGLDLLRKATRQGSDKAGFMLGRLLISRKQHEGFEIIRELSARGFAPASYEVGNCYYTGNLVERDFGKGNEKWSAAASKGHLLARIKTLKHQRMSAPAWKKPIYSANILLTLVHAIAIYLRNENDERVLGSFV
jgi:TPR repeat protein